MLLSQQFPINGSVEKEQRLFKTYVQAFWVILVGLVIIVESTYIWLKFALVYFVKQEYKSGRTHEQILSHVESIHMFLHRLRSIATLAWNWIQLAQNTSCKHGNEPLDSIEEWEFLGQLSDYQLLKKDSTHSTELAIEYKSRAFQHWTCLVRKCYYKWRDELVTFHCTPKIQLADGLLERLWILHIIRHVYNKACNLEK
jgi:hypothetical protein